VALIDNLVSYFKLDESSGTREDFHGTHDLSDTGSTGTAAGKIGNAADFPASVFTYLQNANMLADVSAGSISISFWVWLDSTGSYVALYESTTAQNTFSLFLNGTTGLYVTCGGHAEELTSSTGFTTGAFQHVVVTFNNSTDTITIYRNGSQVAQDATGWGAGPSASSFTLGANLTGGGAHLDGRIDELGVWARVLDSGEVGSLYNSGNGLAYPFSTGDAVPQCWRQYRGRRVA